MSAQHPDVARHPRSHRGCESVYLAAWLPLACARPAWAPLVWTATVSLHYFEWRAPDARLAIGLVEYLPVWVLLVVARPGRAFAWRRA